jgi:oligosaccharide translocation protein RFT1
VLINTTTTTNTTNATNTTTNTTTTNNNTNRYVVFLALNGVTECFMFAAMTTPQVNRHNVWMIGFSAVFLLAAWQFTSLFGSVGFILANCVNMAVRAGRSAFFISRFVATLSSPPSSPSSSLSALVALGVLADALPPPPVLASLALALAVTTLSRGTLCCTLPLTLAHIGLGGVALVAVAVTVWVAHRAFLKDFAELYGGRRRVGEKKI